MSVALILAGGASRRMGRDKLQLAWDEGGLDTVLQHVVDVASHVADKVCLVVPPDCASTDVWGERIQLVHDETCYHGPLQAVAHAWPTDEGDYTPVFVIAGDVPGITPQVLQACLAGLEDGPAAMDAVMVRREGLAQPLLGCYRWKVGEAFQSAALLGERRLMDVLDRLTLRFVDAQQWPEWWTKPIHTPDDYVAWLGRAREV
jgi:molybdenum cofactor guanylyltransferase